MSTESSYWIGWERSLHRKRVQAERLAEAEALRRGLTARYWALVRRARELNDAVDAAALVQVRLLLRRASPAMARVA